MRGVYSEGWPQCGVCTQRVSPSAGSVLRGLAPVRGVYSVGWPQCGVCT